MKKHIIFVFLFFLVAKNFAQLNPEISVYNKSNGLPSNIIYDIKIAKNGWKRAHKEYNSTKITADIVELIFKGKKFV